VTFESPWLGQNKCNIAVHWDGYGKEHKSWGRKIDAPKLDEGFHIFGLLWTPEEYVFFSDGKDYFWDRLLAALFLGAQGSFLSRITNRRASLTDSSVGKTSATSGASRTIFSRSRVRARTETITRAGRFEPETGLFVIVPLERSDRPARRPQRGSSRTSWCTSTGPATYSKVGPPRRAATGLATA